MKKIIIVLAVSFISVIANAANWAWGTKNLYAYGGESAGKYSGEVTLYVYSGSDLVSVATTTAVEGLINADLDTSKFVDNTNFINGEYYKFALSYTSNDYTFTWDAPSNTSGGYIATDVGATQVSFTSMKAATTNTANWTSQNVPEPTSGLLLLCGLAGLALRRKRV